MKGWTGFERLLLLFGFLLLSVYFLAQIYGTFYSRAELQKFSESRQARSGNKQGSAALDVSTPDFQLWSPQRVEHYKASLLAKLPKPLAVLEIPAIHLEVPVLEGTDDLTLDRGAGHIDGTPLPGTAGNIGIAGHRDGFFRVLQDIRVGDTVYLVGESQTGKYVVDETLVVSPDDVYVLGPRSKPSVTLVTCYPFYFVGSAPQRFIVHASLSTLSTESEKGPLNRESIREPGRNNALDLVSRFE